MSSLVLGLAILAGVALPVHGAAPYCLPGDDCFPSDDAITKFNETVGGNLIKTVPYGAACYSASYNAGECASLAAEKSDSDYRLELACKMPVTIHFITKLLNYKRRAKLVAEILSLAGVMYTNFEQYGTIGCPVPDSNTNGSAPAAIEGECTIGNMPSYVVNATSVDDVAAAVKFAAEYNLRLRIKNTGHDYSGRSSGAGSLSIWTHHMDDTEGVPDFLPAGCDLNSSYALSAGPGVDVEALNIWAGENGRVTIGGTTATVGAMGGYILGGGLGPLATHFGMGVDNALQFQVVTADGSIKIANECTNEDLFWALRGGGGTFGVTTRVWIKTYPALAAVNVVAGAIGCESRASYEQLITNLIDAQQQLRDLGHAGLWSCSGDDLGYSIMSLVAYQDEESVASAKVSLGDFDDINNVTGCTPQFTAEQFAGSSSYNDAYQGLIWPAVDSGTPVGINLQVFSRLISFETMDNNLQSIKDYILALPSSIPIIWQNHVGGVTQDIAGDATSVHPDWRNAFAFIDTSNFGSWSGPTAEQNETSEAIVANMTTTFGTAAYYNEAYGYEENWQESYFGSNYDRLLEIKNAVDPDGVFSCRMCVGSEGGF
ncbi:Uu.00g027430.m01.CDS01 [Anthostomella pinea]|uniref:Uu.00g027430.m01.CDS01 n=1 Tax=Anthostomella pinea TaxID=933095 RepID=A0AAI8YCN5_9PEZI|nr:Uu.00g027430.m01.CDS01 [Anthostomella pinea]